MSETTKDTTSVTEVEMDLNEISNFLTIPGADQVMIATPKDTVFTKSTAVDTSFLDSPPEDEKTKLDPEGKVIPISSEASTKVLDSIITDPDEFEDEKKTSGRQKVDKNGLIELAKKLIESGVISPFDEDKDIEKYTQADFEELITANFSEKERKIKADVPMEFFDSLSPELQYIAKYEADGGKDMKGMFRALAEVEESRALDPENERDQELIVRNYLQATNFGTAEDIQEEIDGWKTDDKLESKALKFKPRLDAMQEQVVEQKLVQQEQALKQQQTQAKNYMDNIYKVLEPAEINGIALDKRTQSMLYAGLIQPNYPSLSGKNTNLLGHLLEKYQVVEPNHGLIAEALWLLADPEAYRAKVRDIAVKEKVKDTVRALKTEESKKISSGSTDDVDDNTRKKQSSGIKRPEPNFFKR